MSAVSVKFALTEDRLLGPRRRLGWGVSSAIPGMICGSTVATVTAGMTLSGEVSPVAAGMMSESASGTDVSPVTTGMTSVSASGPDVTSLTGGQPRYRIPAGLTCFFILSLSWSQRSQTTAKAA
jgi:hypothetical protein